MFSQKIKLYLKLTDTYQKTILNLVWRSLNLNAY